MPTLDLTDTAALVTGASRGFGRGIATALTAAGTHVIGLARTAGPLHELHEQLGDRFTPVTGDATDPTLARDLIARYPPQTLVLKAGAVPAMSPVHEQTWETFSRNWHVDTRHVFQWTREALELPLSAGSVVVAVSSGAALRGSPLSGGYAGAKATVRFISAYAAEESGRAALGIRFRTMLPQLTPATDLGTAGVLGYADRGGVEVSPFLESFQPVLTPEQVGNAVVDLAVTADGPAHAEFLISGRGLRPVPQPQPPR
jgi:NAD(P)-dependent dehydrogenase (short-subunit alcohol dehydrogenase family)